MGDENGAGARERDTEQEKKRERDEGKMRRDFFVDRREQKNHRPAEDFPQHAIHEHPIIIRMILESSVNPVLGEQWGEYQVHFKNTTTKCWTSEKCNNKTMSPL